MKRNALMFSRLNFWFENIFFISYQIIYESSMVIPIFLRVLFNIIKLEKIKGLPIFFGFSIIGIPYLIIFGVLRDMMYYIRILCEDQMGDANMEKMMELDI